jgi:DNA-binding response OmpR family regulator
MTRILVMDDDISIRKLLRIMLEAEGYEVMDAADGIEGIRIHRETPADLIITDILMPGKDGWQTITELRNEEPELKIIAISGGGKTSPYLNLSLSSQLGADRVLAKPLAKADLLKTVHAMLDDAPAGLLL